MSHVRFVSSRPLWTLGEIGKRSVLKTRRFGFPVRIRERPPDPCSTSRTADALRSERRSLQGSNPWLSTIGAKLIRMSRALLTPRQLVRIQPHRPNMPTGRERQRSGLLTRNVWVRAPASARIVGSSQVGKALRFDRSMRWFESNFPSQFPRS